MADELVLSMSVAVEKEIDGVEMGVLADGTSYLTGRGLARLCGVAPSAVSTQAKRWEEGDRSSKFAKLLIRHGLARPTLRVKGLTSDAYPDDVCMAFLEYYAFEAQAPSPQSLVSYRVLARGGMRTFVYQALGYDPARQVPPAWRQFHDRQLLHQVPVGYFSVFKELSDFVLASIRGGLPSDEHTIPDISVGIIWAAHWEKEEFDDVFGFRKKCDHNYPDYFPQAASNPQRIWVYPLDALPEFRRWLQNTYVPTKFPKYLTGKVSKGVLGASMAELLLGELQPPQLP